MNENQNKDVNHTPNPGGKMGPGDIPDLLKKIEALLRKVIDETKKGKDENDIKLITIDSLSGFKSRNQSMVFVVRPGVIEKISQSRFPMQYTCDDAILFEYDPVAKDVPKMVIAKCDKMVLNILDENNGIFTVSGN